MVAELDFRLEHMGDGEIVVFRDGDARPATSTEAALHEKNRRLEKLLFQSLTLLKHSRDLKARNRRILIMEIKKELGYD